MAERWRCFVAVPIGDDLRSSLAAAVGDWRSRPDLDGLRWSDPAAWHVTLAFLGATDPARVPDIVARLQEVAAAHAPMRLTTGGLGAFPSARHARVAWYGIDDPDGGLAALAADIGRALDVEIPTPYRPHLTIARARRTTVDLRSWLVEASVGAGTLNVEHMSLMRSHLGRGAASYERLRSTALRDQ